MKNTDVLTDAHQTEVQAAAEHLARLLAAEPIDLPQVLALIQNTGRRQAEQSDEEWVQATLAQVRRDTEEGLAGAQVALGEGLYELERALGEGVDLTKLAPCERGVIHEILATLHNMTGAALFIASQS